MRDFILTAFIFGCLPFTLVRPEWGVLLWTWIGLMNPHRLTWGFAYTLQFAMVVAVVTLIGVLLSPEPKRMPLRPPVVALLAFIVWMCVTTLTALNPDGAYEAWQRTIKVQVFVLVTLVMMQSRARLNALVWVSTLSIAFFGVKGGLYTLNAGGAGMVLGPPGTFIEGNTEISLAITMTLPLLRYLQLQTQRRWLRWGLGAAMVLSAIAILGSYSRGALIAIVAMGLFFLLKTRNKLAITLAFAVIVPAFMLFMPVQWYDRMSTIGEYEQDASAMGRINAWGFAWNLASDRPMVGGGFRAFTPENFLAWAPYPNDFHDSHSIWFQVLGEHGFVGIALFVLLWLLTWRSAARVIAMARQYGPDFLWASDLVRATQVGLIGYWAGGSFLGLAYWDYPYVLMAIIVLAEVVVAKEIKAKEDQPAAAEGQATNVAASTAVVPAEAEGARAHSRLPLATSSVGTHGPAGDPRSVS
jgi:probable O-glycosylation ligase (exosortase A-associated)